MAIMTDSQPIVGAYGDIFTAPEGTPAPTALDVDPTAPWVKLGMISEDGASWTPPEEETAEIKIWQSLYPARVVTTGLSSSLTFALDGWNRTTIPFALGGGTFEDKTDVIVFHPPGAGESVSRAIFLKVLDGDVSLGLYFPKGRVIGREDTVFKPDEAALLNVEFGLEGSVNYEPYQLVFDEATFPDVAVAATGATQVSGAAGTWTPSGATPPANLAGMTGITATPSTVWATDSHMVMGDNAHTYWNATAWVTGDAP